jgi:hypothetical protein
MKKVLPISYTETKKWILKKHYAHRIPSISFAYGVFINNLIEGIITYGIPPSPKLVSSICGEKYKDDVLELNRLVINSKTPKNTASYLVANSMKMLPKKKWIIVSFADTNKSHIGYIYQATNFIYTGLSQIGGKDKNYILNKKEYHGRRITKAWFKEKNFIYDKDKTLTENWLLIGGEIEEQQQKHRYIIFVGTKDDKKELKNNFKLKVFPYPKGKSERYDCIDITEKQKTLISI